MEQNEGKGCKGMFLRASKEVTYAYNFIWIQKMFSVGVTGEIWKTSLVTAVILCDVSAISNEKAYLKKEFLSKTVRFPAIHVSSAKESPYRDIS